MFNRIKRHFESKKVLKDDMRITGEVFGDIVFMNDYVNIIHDACKICYKSKHEETQEGKLKYIAKRIATGHESILEHSNIVSYYTFDTQLSDELGQVLTCCKYLNTKVYKVNDNQSMLIIAGSIRGYKHIIKTITNPQNKIFSSIMNNMYRIEKEFFGDLINDNIMAENKFYPDNNEGIQKHKDAYNSILGMNYKITSHVSSEVLEYLIEEAFPIKISKRDVMDLVTITIKFKDISRIISQQYTRHRAAITQESQRYVDYSDSAFNSPANFKEEYDYHKKYNIILNGNTSKLTMSEIGEEEIKIYHQLREQGVKKEDCRAFLPNNTRTSFYMTFTYSGFTKFLELRTHPAAQAEIRQTANLLLERFLNILQISNEDELYSEVLTPYYKWIEFGNVDMSLLEEPVK